MSDEATGGTYRLSRHQIGLRTAIDSSSSLSLDLGTGCFKSSWAAEYAAKVKVSSQ